MKKILIFAPFFSPAYKAGGPIKSIKSLADFLSKDYEIYIFTNNRDIDGSLLDIDSNKWINCNNYSVFYTDKIGFIKNINIFLKLIKKVDLIYLNSFFNLFYSFFPFLLFSFFKVKFLIAPRGEFCDEALKIKKNKKKLFLCFVSLFFKGLLKRVSWHFTSNKELKESINNMSKYNILIDKFYLASNLSNVSLLLNSSEDIEKKYSLNYLDKYHCLKLVFLSRISPIKNLKFCLVVLKEVKSNVIFDIYGPIENKEYWEECCEIINSLPENIKVRYLGSVDQNHVKQVLEHYNVFFLPTLGENFGHAIYEALSAGLLTLISDNTPWVNLSKYQVGYDLPLDSINKFVDIIEGYSFMSKIDLEKSRLRSKEFVSIYLNENQIKEDINVMFYSVLNDSEFKNV